MHTRKRLSRRVVCSVLVVCLMIGTIPGVATATPPANPPHDIQDHWAYDAIRFMLERGYMQGTSDTTFAPNLSLSRAMAVTILHRMAGEPVVLSTPSFSDVKPDQWYSDAVVWAHNRGVVQGVGDGRFAPAVSITREQLAVILYRFAFTEGHDVTVASGAVMDFPDANLISDWARAEMEWAVYHGLMRGTNAGTLNPQGNATRAAAATVSMRFWEQFTPRGLCPGCGDERFFRTPSLDSDFQDNAVIIVLTRCVSQRDNRDWTLDDFGDIDGALYLRDLMRLDDWQWELIQAGRWQETMVNWPQFRRIMLIRLDQHCKENVVNVIHQLQQLEFVRAASPSDIMRPG